MIDLRQGDCLELMKDIPDNSIDLVIIDPPYNINKAKWDKIKDYTNWLGNIINILEKKLKSNGSFYMFHNDFLKIVDIQNYINNNSNLIFRQFIVWNKRFDGCENKGFLDGFVETNQLRNYQKMCEYCLYYTFQDGTGLSKIKNDTNNFVSLRKYFKELQEKLNMNKKQIIEKIGQQADHCFRWNSSQWDLPTKETYENILNLLKEKNNIKEFEELKQEHIKSRREYEELRKEYEESRYTYNNKKTHHSVWNYNIAKKQGHITPKPVNLLENIILHSSNETDIVLDCFMGSGSTGVACKNTSRNFIGIELDKQYFEVAKKRILEVIE
jgi:site-specific DNA-methyltransferase (adenine-specific)